MSCTTIKLQKSARFCKGAVVTPGIKPHLYYITRSEITAWPTREAVGTETAATDPEKVAKYTGNFTLAADAAWHRIDLVENAGTIQWETQGSKYARTYAETLEVRFPDAENENARGLQAIALHQDLIFLVPSNSGKYYVLGNENFDVEVTGSGTFGEGLDSDDQGVTFSLSVTDTVPPVHYPGNIVTEEEGTISGATGKPVTA